MLRTRRTLLALTLAGCTSDIAGTGHGPAQDAAPPSEDAGGAPEHDAGLDSSVTPGGEDASQPFDTSVLAVAEDASEVPCRLTPERLSLLVDVENRGSVTTPAIPIGLRANGVTVALRAPELTPGSGATLVFDRTAVPGYVGDGRFEIVVDPDGEFGAPQPPISGACNDLRSRALLAAPVLHGFFDTDAGLFKADAQSVGEWWTGANMLEVTIDHMRELGDPRYLDVIERSFAQGARSYPYADDNFLNDYYDDEGWWALAWIKAYDLTHDPKYLELAKRIFEDMTHGWKDDHCGGGLFWRKTDQIKNAIPNELFLTAAARLHLRTPGDTAYLAWAQREWAWFQASGMLGADGRVMDGMNSESCVPGGPAYTYNQGVILGGLVELFRATSEASLLDAAERIADAALATMTNGDGVFIEAVCDPSCDDGDGVQFKGVFTRNLAALYEARPKASYRTFLIRQSDALWEQARSPENALGKYWQGPFDRAEPKRQSSALDALVAAVRTAEVNLALRASATGSMRCSPNEDAVRAIDGSVAHDSKWCSGDPQGSLVVDLGTARSVVGFRVRHASAGGEDSGFNTRDFEVETSLDGQLYERAVTVTGNTDGVTTHPIAARAARYVRLHASVSQTRMEFPATRI